jgi:hypothetical protein
MVKLFETKRHYRIEYRRSKREKGAQTKTITLRKLKARVKVKPAKRGYSVRFLGYSIPKKERKKHRRKATLFGVATQKPLL